MGTRKSRHLISPELEELLEVIHFPRKKRVGKNFICFILQLLGAIAGKEKYK